MHPAFTWVFLFILSLKGKNQRNFKKTKIAKMQKGPQKDRTEKNEQAHFFPFYPFEVMTPSVPLSEHYDALTCLLPCNIQQNLSVKFFAELFFKKATVSLRQIQI